MATLRIQYIENNLGEKVAVILPIDDYNKIMERLKELEEILKKTHKEYEIPQVHQKLVNERFKKVRKDPERLKDWDKAKKDLKA